jgi:outer membrane OprD family porin
MKRLTDRIRFTMPHFAMRLGLILLVALAAWRGPAWADDAPPPPPQPAPLEALFLPLRELIKPLPPFLGDTDLKVHYRSYYFNRMKPDDTANEAYALGGWIGYQSGWLLDTFAMGATLYGSAPIYTPPDRDGTLLLQPGQNGYYVPGQAWGALRYGDYALLKGYRQLVDQTYINSQDNRMTPNTFQGVTVGGKVAWMQYLSGFLWKIKPRNSDDFISMSAQAGAVNTNDGVGLFGVRLTPLEGLRFDVSNQYGVNTFNTIYAEAEYRRPLSENWKLVLGAQFTDQRAVGDALLPKAGGKLYWDTQAGGARIQAVYKDLTLTGAFSITGAGNNIQSPWGSFPGYLSIIELDFDRAQEKAVLVGAAYDFKKLIDGLYGNVNFAWGWDAITPSTGKNAPTQAEYDITIDYRPTFEVPILKGIWKGIWFRVRSAIVDQQDAKTLGYQFRITINWDRDLI